MKLNLLVWLKKDEGETIAHFGEARLVKKPSGKIILVGGTDDDRIAAKEWASFFQHEATI